jgi:hypothetical protein
VRDAGPSQSAFIGDQHNPQTAPIHCLWTGPH